MIITLRLLKIIMVASIALFFSIVAFDNIVDPKTNWLFVQHVLSMDTTFHEPVLMSRAINNPMLQHAAYYVIIFWESMTALVCWLGEFFLLRALSKSDQQFQASKKCALIGLSLGFILYMFGFMIVASEWFAMWQSSTWNGQRTAGLFVTLILFVMLFLIDTEHK